MEITIHTMDPESIDIDEIRAILEERHYYVGTITVAGVES